MFEVTDDSGFLALIVPAAYQAYFSKKWTFDQMEAHLKQQMERRTLLIWGTGLEGFWRVYLNLEKTAAKGFREVMGPLRVLGGTVLVTNYESLTMAAEFEDVKLPQAHEEECLVAVPDGDYSCRIVQMFDPENQDCAEDGDADFLIELLWSNHNPATWTSIPWFELDS